MSPVASSHVVCPYPSKPGKSRASWAAWSICSCVPLLVSTLYSLVALGALDLGLVGATPALASEWESAGLLPIGTGGLASLKPLVEQVTPPGSGEGGVLSADESGDVLALNEMSSMNSSKLSCFLDWLFGVGCGRGLESGLERGLGLVERGRGIEQAGGGGGGGGGGDVCGRGWR